MELYIEGGGVSERSWLIKGIKCLLNGRLKKNAKFRKAVETEVSQVEDERAGR